MPAVKTGTVKKSISEFEKGERGAVSVHSVSSGDVRSEFTLIIRPAKDEDDARETATGSKEGKRESVYHAFATNISTGRSHQTLTGSSRPTGGAGG